MFHLLLDQLRFPESPFWSDQDRCLYFVEWMGDAVQSLRNGAAEILFNTEPGGGPSGLAQTDQGDFWVCLYSAQKLVRYSPIGIPLQVIDSYRGYPFKGPNDLTLDNQGGVYFTDGGDYADDWETGRPAGAVYYLNPEGQLSQVDANVCFPNGIALSPDVTSLYVNEHRQNRTLIYPLARPGVTIGRSVFHDLDHACLLEPSAAFELGPDGLCVDPAGRLWIAHYGGGKLVQVSPEGKLLRTLYLPQGKKPTNVCYVPSKNLLFATEAELGLLYSVDLNQR